MLGTVPFVLHTSGQVYKLYRVANWPGSVGLLVDAGEGAGADEGSLVIGVSLVGAPAGLGEPLEDVHQRGLEAAAIQRYTTTT